MLLTGWLFLGGFLLAGYALLMLAYWRAWQMIPQPQVERVAYSPLHPVTVLIPARNEAANIENCLASLTAQNYPTDKLHVIVIDDHSEDDTADMVSRWSEKYPNLRLLRNGGLGKKAAIKTGIEASTTDWVVCTDADCTFAPNWLSIISTEWWKGHRFVAGPVKLTTAPGLLAAFQQIDFMMMQGITASAVTKGWMSMCNGANIAYRRDDFFAVKGFEGIDGVPTGDDMLLMHKINQAHPNTAVWLRAKEAIVTTPPCATWGSFLQQRIRWGSKATIFSDKRIFWVLLLVYLFNAWLLCSMLAMAWVAAMPVLVLLFFLGKMVCEFPLIYATAQFFTLTNRLHWFVLLQPLHVLYITVAGWLGQFGSYGWKGRRIVKT